VDFTKLQGAGNDFILVETDKTGGDWPEVAWAMCDRHYGIGADGLLLLLPSAKADFRMRMFNPDGSEAEACGNGLRCLAKYIIDKKLSPQSQIKIETMAGIRAVRFNRTGKSVEIQTSMGVPKFGAGDIPVEIEPGSRKLIDIKSMLGYTVVIDGRELCLNLVSMGNPHAVYFSPQPVARFLLSQIGPKVEHLAVFPRRTNFEVVNVINRGQIDARVWERGAGETLACGSGAGAIAVAAQKYGYVDNKVAIALPGGVLKVEWDGVGEVFLSGPAEKVFTGVWEK